MNFSELSEFILPLLGGLALFLYGMKMMSNGLEAAAGDKLKGLLEKLTTNRFSGLAVGTGITAAVQSSSATTVMVVGFVNSGIMTLAQATWVIMGANIGTNITSQLIALDISALAPIIAIVGVSLIVFLKSKKLHHIGLILAGLGILFIGMSMMSGAMKPLRDEPFFINMMTQFTNPLFGVMVGVVFTALIQSSSASVGILQSLAATGLIGLPSAIFVLFGQNIGTCVTAALASIGTSRNAKRAAMIHLLFNVIGTFVFSIIVRLTPFENFVMSLTPDRPAAQIANAHLIFNVTTTLMLLPFGLYLVKLVHKLLPDKPGDEDLIQCVRYLDRSLLKNEYSIGSITIFIIQLRREIDRMLTMARENIDRSFLAIHSNSATLQEEIETGEDYIDYLNKEISFFISHMIAAEMSEKESIAINAYFKITGNIERIGDHAMNIAGYANLLERKGLRLSDKAMGEVEQMRETCLHSLDFLYEDQGLNLDQLLKKMEEAEQLMDDMTMEFRNKQIDRMISGECSGEACVIYAEMLTDFERLGDHLLNIAQTVSSAKLDEMKRPDNLCIPTTNKELVEGAK
ncbi:MAG: Na/Pi cotransporter family protein [Clostridiaceae bacterium]|nr:Na/Pi cotransporter family protein [Clostridiaceae bacterium]